MSDSFIKVPISPGEMLDKITILEIKQDRIDDANKVKNVTVELNALRKTQENAFEISGELSEKYNELKTINEQLWVIEDDIRDCERNNDFSDTFIQLARAVYVTNDERARVKREINVLLGSTLIEEKSYASYT